MTTVIKGGTIVTADLTYEADVLIDGGMITAIGTDLKGDKVIDATGCYVMPGGIDPHTHLEMPFMGTTAAEDFRERHPRRALRRHHHGGRFRASPARTSRCSTRCDDLGPEGRARRPATIPSTWPSPGGASRCSTEMAEVVKRGVNTFKHFMAYKGALMVNDDEMFASFLRCAELGALPLVHAENGDVVAAPAAEIHGATASPGRRAMPIRARRRSRARRPTAPS